MGIEPTLSHLWYQLSYQQDGGEEGYTSASSWCPQLKINFSYETPLGDDAATSGTQLDALAQLIKDH